ncbi:MAG: gfo/Idh/MocA family oxidoreductase, partial [Bacteroidetes bacterium]
MSSTLNWGILGPGKIAHKFAEDLQALPEARVHAVASRSLERARAFAERFEAPFAFGNYEDLLGCADLDVVYVATPHSEHFTHTMMCLEAGVPVLCEKPLAIHAGQARRMVEKARTRGVFLMEGLWTRFNPAFEKALEVVGEGGLGTIHWV